MSWVGSATEIYTNPRAHSFYARKSQGCFIPNSDESEEVINEEWVRKAMLKQKTKKIKAMGKMMCMFPTRKMSTATSHSTIDPPSRPMSPMSPPSRPMTGCSTMSRPTSSLSTSRDVKYEGEQARQNSVSATISEKRLSGTASVPVLPTRRRSSGANRKRRSSGFKELPELSEIISEEAAKSLHRSDSPTEAQQKAYFNPNLKVLHHNKHSVRTERSHFHEQTDLELLNISIEEGQQEMEQKARRLSRKAVISKRLLTPKSNGFSSRPCSASTASSQATESTATKLPPMLRQQSSWLGPREDKYRLMTRLERTEMRQNMEY